MSTSIAQNIEALCQEQGIDRDLVIEAIKEAVRAAAKKQFKGGEDIQVDWTPETGLELSASKVVVEDVTDASTELSIEEARELGGDESLARHRPHRGENRLVAEAAGDKLLDHAAAFLAALRHDGAPRSGDHRADGDRTRSRAASAWPMPSGA